MKKTKDYITHKPVKITVTDAKGYDWKVTAKKFSITAGIVICSGLISVYADNPAWLSIIPLVEGIRNYLKHRKV